MSFYFIAYDQYGQEVNFTFDDIICVYKNDGIMYVGNPIPIPIIMNTIKLKGFDNNNKDTNKLNEFNFRFFDNVNYKQGIYKSIVAVDLLQAKDFAYQIVELLGSLNSSDWDKETIRYEYLSQ